MNATNKIGIWEDNTIPGVKIIYDCNRYPERITVLKQGGNPLHYEFPDGIGTSEIEQIRKFILS